MTEGGDLDKLGRGHFWNGRIPGCLHQNHIFAVRCFQIETLIAYRKSPIHECVTGQRRVTEADLRGARGAQSVCAVGQTS